MTQNKQSMETVTGGCLCRAVRYRITAAPIVTRMCWCRDCQYFAAGNSSVNVCFPSNAIEIEGKLTDYRSVADSGNVMHRRFCPSCGTPMFSEAESRPHLIFVRAGTLDDTSLANPSMNIWTSSAPQWACLDPKLPKVEKQPPPAG
jgi:hypothetical protein